VTRWPLWRLLVWVEAWLLAIGAVHRYHAIHEAFAVPMLIALVPGIAIVALWGLARAAVGQGTAPEQRASWFEVCLAVLAVAGALGWIVEWAVDARQRLVRFDQMVGQATLIVDVSLTGLSAAACLAALALDWILATAHESLRLTMIWVRRTHVVVTAIYVVALFGSAWMMTRWPDTAATDAADVLGRIRATIYIYEFAQATVFPVQAFFAATAVAVVTFDSRDT
jgi:hypothetical protein